MTEPISSERPGPATLATPPAMPSILASAVAETRQVAAITRRAIALLLSRT